MTDDRRGFAQLQDVLMDDEFPGLDVALRRGRHVDRDDLAWYALLSDGQEWLEAFYRRYGCELVHKSDGFFYLLPTSDRVPRRHLAVGDMLVGQALALQYLDPASVERGGVITREQVVAQLVAVLGEDGLVAALHARRRRLDERVAHKMVRGKIADAVKRLAALGFVDLVGDEQLRLRPALLRFAEPVRGLAAPAEALARLVAEGEVAMARDLAAEDGDGDDAGDPGGRDDDDDDGDGDDGGGREDDDAGEDAPTVPRSAPRSARPAASPPASAPARPAASPPAPARPATGDDALVGGDGDADDAAGDDDAPYVFDDGYDDGGDG